MDSSAFVRVLPATVSLPLADQDENALAQDRPFIVVSSLDALKRLHPAFSADTSTEEWLGILVHEYFHILQLRVLGLTSPPERSRLNALFQDDAHYRHLLEAEHAVLAEEAARADVDAARADKALRAWNELYQARRGYLSTLPNGDDLIQLDAMYSYIEGLARYVENQYLVNAEDHPHDDRSPDPGFHNFIAYENRGYAAMSGRRLKDDYYYTMGMHVALLLDRSSADWIRNVHAAPEWLLGRAVALAQGT